MNIDDGDEIFQESPRLKAVWLEEAQRRWPIGMRVRVKASDVQEYIGLTGVVTNYDVGIKGDWPLVGVKFEPSIAGLPLLGGVAPARDGFYDDELEAI